MKTLTKKEAAKTAHMLTNKTWRIFEAAITGDNTGL